MTIATWWSNRPQSQRNALQIVWCVVLVFILVLFWVQKHDFVYAAF